MYKIVVVRGVVGSANAMISYDMIHLVQTRYGGVIDDTDNKEDTNNTVSIIDRWQLISTVTKMSEESKSIF